MYKDHVSKKAENRTVAIRGACFEFPDRPSNRMKRSHCFFFCFSSTVKNLLVDMTFVFEAAFGLAVNIMVLSCANLKR